MDSSLALVEVVVKLCSRLGLYATLVLLALCYEPDSFAGELQPLMGIKGRDLRSFRAGAIAKSDYPVDGGVMVTFVYPDGPASEAGLEPDDIIASSGRTVFSNVGEFLEWLKTTSDGNRYPLVVWRYDDSLWKQRELVYRAAWGIRDEPLSQGTAWDGPLFASVAEPIVYIASNEKSTLWSDGSEFVTVEYDGHAAVEGFFNLGGAPTRAFISSSDEKVLKVSYASMTLADIAKVSSQRQLAGDNGPIDGHKGPPRFRFFAAGAVKITVEVGKRKVVLPLKVEWSPVSPGDSAEHVIKTIGLPDWKSDVTVFWPESDRIDRFFYTPSARDSFIAASHWRYKKYPGLVLSMQDGVLKEISSDYSGVPVDETKLASSGGIRRWTAKSGHTLDAAFVRFRRGLVTLKDTAGKTKDVRLTDLSNVDRDYVRRTVRKKDREK